MSIIGVTPFEMDCVDKKNTLYFLAILEGNTIIPLTPEESPKH